MKTYDCIIIGAGSVGCPAAYYMAKEKRKVLVLDTNSAPGQGENKAAIGGIRATHSDPAKITICLESLNIYRHWEEETGISIDWKEGGYCFPVYEEKDEKTLKSILPIQKEFGLNIDWVSPEKIMEVVPGISERGLRGGTYSPNDGQVSPLRAAQAFTDEAIRLGADFHFNESVTGLIIENNAVKGVRSDKGEYYGSCVINAAGAKAKEIGAMAGLDIPVVPDSHEAGISAPVKPFLGPLVVDIRQGQENKTENFYFAQMETGQIIFCYTPREKFYGENRAATSEFVPVVAGRLIELIPKFKYLTFRRLWRGLYPMTPDGSAIVDKVKEVDNLYLAVGMCGQGLMMGPGVARNLVSLIINGEPLMKKDVFEKLSFYRDFYKSGEEKLK